MDNTIGYGQKATLGDYSSPLYLYDGNFCLRFTPGARRRPERRDSQLISSPVVKTVMLLRIDEGHVARVSPLHLVVPHRV